MSNAKPKRQRRVEQPGNPDQVTEAKHVEQQANLEAIAEEELLSNVRYVTHKEPPIGTVQGNFVLTANGWSQHAERTAKTEVDDQQLCDECRLGTGEPCQGNGCTGTDDEQE